ncbi:MAG TPA: dTDP-4-dehydrorhamnose reductase [Methylophilus sp.]|nr:dTDP-4-dehydrorhamnose reductase [Methylophilus sp.]HQQ34121.1 dTDP-4-dehydrorhamnose reductase [Methylophilus sp.]
MKILLTGVNGQVGHALLSRLTEHTVVALAREALDLTRPEDIRRVVHQVQPDLIINPAAYTAVDKAESELELAYAINATAPQVFAEEAVRLGAALIHFSTDYVYDGCKSGKYVETDTSNPVSVYGKSKLAGEEAIRSSGVSHLILRTSWVYGAYGKNFLKTILRLAVERDSLRIVADQWGAPTSSESIADGVRKLLDTWQVKNAAQTGIYHFTNTGETTWHGFAVAIVNEYESLKVEKKWPDLKVNSTDILPISTADYPTPAKRPANSMLDNAKLKDTFSVELPTWQSALKQVMRELA